MQKRKLTRSFSIVRAKGAKEGRNTISRPSRITAFIAETVFSID